MLKYGTEIFPPRFSVTVLRELDADFSRRTVDVAASDGPLPFGLVLCEADGVYAPLTVTKVQQAAEGETPATTTEETGTACAILITPLDASETKRRAVILTGYAILNVNKLVWDASVTDKKAALAQLEARGFVLREVADAAE